MRYVKVHRLGIQDAAENIIEACAAARYLLHLGSWRIIFAHGAGNCTAYPCARLNTIEDRIARSFRPDRGMATALRRSL
jgi:hypothetical protein